MNCKPGDLARLVGLPDMLRDARDRIVTLKNEPPVLIDGEIGWALEHPVRFTMRGTASRKGVLFLDGDRVYFDVMQDKYLRPIRDPGDDAVDEMVRLVGLPVGMPEGVPA